jgi:hypothetical protein
LAGESKSGLENLARVRLCALLEIEVVVQVVVEVVEIVMLVVGFVAE